MLVLGALLDTNFRAAHLWQRWLEVAGPSVHVVAHCYREPQHPYQRVPKVPTTWRRTLAARIELLRAAVNVPGMTHVQLVSESCVPLLPPGEVVLRLCVGRESTLSLYPTPFWRPDEGQKLPDNRSPDHGAWGRKTNPEVWPHLHYHEQWLCLSRRHALALLAIESDLRRWFVGCDADNECDLGTALAKLGHLGDCSRAHTHHVTWPQGPASFHPRDVTAVPPTLRQKALAAGPRVCFLRKVGRRATLRELYSPLGL